MTVKAPSQPPVNALVIINDGATETTTAKVNLSLYATGASYMKISQDPTFADAGKWLPYQTSYDLTLTGGLGKKTVYVKYQSAAGDESAVASATINYVEVKVKPPVATSTPPAPQGQPVTPGQPAPVVQPGGVQPPPASTPQGGVVPPVTYVNRIIRNYNYIILHQPNALPPQLPIVVSPAPNSFVLQNALTITGQAPPNTIVTLHIHSPQAVEVKVVTDANGNFVYKLDETVLSAGDHQVYASVDQPDSSLVGPAIDFALLSQPQPAVPAKITAPIVTAFNFQLDLRVWWWLLAIWLFFMIVIFFGFGRLLVYIKANSRINLGFLSRVPTWQILSLLAAIMLIILGVVGILIWR